MAKKIVAGNWKMNTSISEGIDLVKGIDTLKKDENVISIVAPPFTHLSSILELDLSSVKVAAQDCHYEDSGAFTGNISPKTLKEMGVEFVIIGHSERRLYQQESNEILKRKIDSALKNNLKPIFCCGESLEVRESGRQNSFVLNQLLESLFHLSSDDIQKIIIAYEPIWAIGTGVTASSTQAEDMHSAIRGALAEKYGESISSGISILYGGSCKPSNAEELFSQPNINGGLIGGAALNPESFVGIINSY